MMTFASVLLAIFHGEAHATECKRLEIRWLVYELQEKFCVQIKSKLHPITQYSQAGLVS